MRERRGRSSLLRSQHENNIVVTSWFASRWCPLLQVDMEASEGVPSATARNIEKIQKTLQAAGVIFIDEDDEGPGVRLRKRRD